MNMDYELANLIVAYEQRTIDVMGLELLIEEGYFQVTTDAENPVAVVFEDDTRTVLAKFPTIEAASEFIDTLPAASEGIYGIDAPVPGPAPI